MQFWQRIALDWAFMFLELFFTICFIVFLSCVVVLNPKRFNFFFRDIVVWKMSYGCVQILRLEIWESRFEGLSKLNQVEPSVNFKYELEKNNLLPFLDILLINNNKKLEFKVYHKINNKNDYIHFYSNHSDETKSGILISFS